MDNVSKPVISIKLRQVVGILMVTTLISSILGLIRNVIIANRVGLTYGTIAPLDSYYAAFALPDIIYSILIAGALSSAVLPMLVGVDETDPSQYWKAVNNFMAVGAIVILVTIILLYFALPVLIPLIFSGLNPSEIDLTIDLARLLLLSPLLFTVSQISTAALQTKRQFTAPALAPIIYNLGIITGALLIPNYGLKVLVIGVLIGASGHLLIQVPALLQLGWRPIFDSSISPMIKKSVKLMLPRIIAIAANSLMFLALLSLSSNMTKGSIAIFQLTDNLQAAPAILFAHTLTTAILPEITRHFQRQAHLVYHQLISRSLRFVLFWLIPLTIWLIILAPYLIQVYISLGQTLSADEVSLVIKTFRLFIISICFQGCGYALIRAHFAKFDTKTPAIISVITFVITVTLGLIFAKLPSADVSYMALAFSIGSISQFLLLFASLKIRTSFILDDHHGRPNFPVIILGSIVSMAVLLICRPAVIYIVSLLDAGYTTQNMLNFTMLIFIALAVYLLVARIYNIEQWQILKNHRIFTPK